ncbi:MAG TPA: hypothetical protein VFV27_12650 [Nevskiaceae bacterium]|nr:hypothetical protein [Nevskiaceae bacterium]
MNRHHRFAYLLLGALLSPLSAAYAQTEEPRITRLQARGTITANLVTPITSSTHRFVLNEDGSGFYFQDLSQTSTGTATEGRPMQWLYRQGKIQVTLNTPLSTRFTSFNVAPECGNRQIEVLVRNSIRRFVLSAATGPDSLKINGTLASVGRTQTSSREACYIPTDEATGDPQPTTLSFERSRVAYRADQIAARQFQLPVPITGGSQTALVTFFEGGTGTVEGSGQSLTWTVGSTGALEITFADGTAVSYLRTTSLLSPREYYVNGLVTVPGQVEKGVITGQEILAAPRPFRRSDAPAEFHSVNVGSDYPDANPDPDTGFYFVLREGGEGEVVFNGEPAPLHDWFIDSDGRLVIDRTGGPFQGCEPGVDEGCFIFNRRALKLVRLSADRYYVIEEFRFNTDPSIPIESVTPQIRPNWYTHRPLGSSRP